MRKILKKSKKPPPEGAEVKIIGENLSKIIGSRTLISVSPLSGRYTKKPIEGLDSNSLPGKVLGIGVRGKLIFWLLDNDTYILNTLAMTGSWSDSQTKHSRIIFEFDTGNPVYFNDIRNFGTLKLIRGRNLLVSKLDSIGPDMLSENVDDDLFTFCMRVRSQKSICEALMDQSLVSGVGNYVKAEALYRAKISPYRIVDSLDAAEMSDLNASVKSVLRQAYADQGASIRDYRQPNGTTGQATLQFKVYGKKQDPDGNKVVKEETPDGRITHWCPDVQK